MRERHPKGDAWSDKHSRAQTESGRQKAMHEAGCCVVDTCVFCWEEHLEFTNADRMDDVESGHPMGDSRATYLDDGA